MALGALFVFALFAWQHGTDARARRNREQLRPQDVDRELQCAPGTANCRCARAGASRRPSGGIAQRLQRFTMTRRSAQSPWARLGATIFDWRAPSTPSPSITREAIEPVRSMTESLPGASTPRRLGEVRVSLIESTAPHTAIANRLSDTHQTNFMRAIYLAAAVAALAACLAAIFGWRAGRKLERPLGALIKSAERFGQGDYTRPVDVLRRDRARRPAEGAGAHALQLRQTTINKNYLHSVLNGMTDAVFVTSPDGVVRLANPAACKLLGYAEGEIHGQDIAVILEERERPGFDLRAGRA